MDDELPLISAEGLRRAQRQGRSCASCRKTWPLPGRPVARLLDGTVLMACGECTITLEPASSPLGPPRVHVRAGA